MTTGSTNLPDTPAPTANAVGDGPPINGAPKKATGLITPSRLRQVLFNDISSSPSLVTATDYLPPSPLNGKDGSGSTNSTNGMKRPRVDDHGNLRNGTRDINIRPAPTDCRDQVALALDKDRRLYEAKIKMFQDCADAIDKTLQKAGTELYPCAKDFSTFFAGCLTEWLRARGPPGSPPQTPATPASKGDAGKPNCARPVHEGACAKSIPKCANCSGPHSATSERCPARPKVVRGIIRKPTTEQLREIRLTGERARSHAFDEARKEAETANTTMAATGTMAGNGAEDIDQNGGDPSTLMEVDTAERTNRVLHPNKEADTIVVRE